MTKLEGNVTPVLTWDRWEDRKIRLAVVCHCGEIFPMYALDQARAHVAGHEVEGGEPS
jgi:hypothetical protein